MQVAQRDAEVARLHAQLSEGQRQSAEAQQQLEARLARSERARDGHAATVQRMRGAEARSGAMPML